jgi:hypothetical protein
MEQNTAPLHRHTTDGLLSLCMCGVCLGVGEAVTRAVHTLACVAEGAYVPLGGGGKKKAKANALDPTQATAPLRLVQRHTPHVKRHTDQQKERLGLTQAASLYCIVLWCSCVLGSRWRPG